jgi:hypothetical protein
MARSLYGNGHHSLMLGASSGPSPGVNLCPFRDETAKFHRVLIVNLFRLLGTEDADFASRYIFTTGANATLLLVCLCSHCSYLSSTKIII